MDNHSMTKGYKNGMIKPMKDKSRYSKASKERMMKLTPEERKAHMSMMAKKLWATRTPEQRSEHAKKMVRAKFQARS